MKITAALCILACVVASVQSAAPANCKDEVAYANKWEYTGSKGNAACKKYMACPMQHEKMVPQVKQCKRLTYFDPTSATCSSKYKCPVTEKEKNAAKEKANAIATAQTTYDEKKKATDEKKTALVAAEKTKTETAATAAADNKAMEAAKKAVADKKAECEEAKIEALETAETQATEKAGLSKTAAGNAETAVTTATGEHTTAKGESDDAKTALDAAKKAE